MNRSLDQPKEKDLVPPQPQRVKCDQYSDQEAKYVGFPYQNPPKFMSKKYLKKEQKNNPKLHYFKLDDITKDWQNAFLYADRDFLNPLNYYCKYIQDQSFCVTKEEIDESIDKIQDEFLFKTDQLRTNLKQYLDEHQKYYREKVLSFIQPYEKIKKEYEDFVFQLRKHKCDDLQSQQTLKTTLQAFGAKISNSLSVKDFQIDSIVEKTDQLRKGQPKFINKNIWDHYQNKILSEIQAIENNYICKNSFIETAIPNQDYIFEILQKIKEDKEYKEEPQKLRHELKDKLTVLFKSTNQNLVQELHKQKADLTTGVTIALIKTSTDQSIGFYYNAKRKDTSLLFSLTKRIAFNIKANQELTLAEDVLTSPFLRFGSDLVIPNDFKNCTSNLGEAFDLRGEGQNIGNKAEFLGNGIHFDIEYFELYRVNDPDLTKLPPFFPPPQIFPPTNQPPPQPPNVDQRNSKFPPPKK